MRNINKTGHRFKNKFLLFLSLIAVSVFLYSQVVFARVGGFTGINNLTGGYGMYTGGTGFSGLGMPMNMGGYMGGYTGGFGNMMLGGYGMGFAGNSANTAAMLGGFGMGYGTTSPLNTGFMNQYGGTFGNMYMNTMTGAGYGGTNNTTSLFMNQYGNSNTYGNTNMYGMNSMSGSGMSGNLPDSNEYTDFTDPSRHMMGHFQGGMGSEYWGEYEFDSGTVTGGMPFLPNAISSEGYMGYMSGMGTGNSTFIPAENTATGFGNWPSYFSNVIP